ncbi:MAG: hypothetical protein U9Q61_08020 [Thermodesulfobacteriota bacterium]|nr:hypothetical protein [Thermodesulfobacteriota bacterium]
MGYFRQKRQINVVYKNGVKDHLSPALLTTLINSKQIEQFERSSGWVTVGIDSVRGAGKSSFTGAERRAG